MAIELSNRTKRNLENTSIEPVITVVIEGAPNTFSTGPVLDFIEIGCPDLFIDGTWFIGGFKKIEGNKSYIDSRSTTFTIRQQINHDEGKSSSISQMTIGLVDKNKEVTDLISPGLQVEDIMGRKVQVLLGFGQSSFFEDYVEIFKGFVTKVNSGAGIVRLGINHPETKKKITLFKTASTGLASSINATDTVIPLSDASSFFEPSGPLATYAKVGDEIFRYTGISGNSLTGVTRGQLGTIGAPHSLGDEVASRYALEDNPIDLALKIMMSGFGTDPYVDNVNATSFVNVGNGTDLVNNSIFFDGLNIPRDLGVQIGDTVTITGATNGANNITTRTITDLQLFNTGYYIVVDGAPLILETTTAAVAQFFSQYNVLPDGMRMRPDEIDIEEHIKLRDFFHSSSQVRIFLKDSEVEGRELIDEQLFKPFALYSVPRKARVSLAYTVGPIPGEFIQTIDINSVKNPKDVTVERSTNRSFFNEVVYKYEDDPASDEEKFTRGLITISQDSKNRIPGATETYIVESIGLREDLNAANIAASQSQRILDRYKFGAERINCDLLFRDGMPIDIGDIVVFDGLDLQVSDITIGNRRFQKRLMEVLNKSLNIKTGDTSITLLDTGINIDTRYGLMSPCSLISGVISASQFTIGPDPVYPSKFGADEGRKWENIPDNNSFISVLIRNDDYTIQEDLVVTGINGNTFTLQNPATITLTAGLMVEFTGYVDADTSDKQKLIYAYMTDSATFPDGENQYSMI